MTLRDDDGDADDALTSKSVRKDDSRGCFPSASQACRVIVRLMPLLCNTHSQLQLQKQKSKGGVGGRGGGGGGGGGGERERTGEGREVGVRELFADLTTSRQ